MPVVDWELVKQWGPWAVIAYALWHYKDLWLPWVRKLFSGSASPNAAPSLQDATSHVAALIEYFGKVGCKEGAKAARDCGQCLFHETHTGEA